MEADVEKIIDAYLNGDSCIRRVIRDLYPDLDFGSLDSKELMRRVSRVKTIEDACMVLGRCDYLVKDFIRIKDFSVSKNTYSYSALKIVCAALNELWAGDVIMPKSALYMPVFDVFKKGDSYCVSVKSWRDIDYYTIKIQEIEPPHYCQGLCLYSKELAIYAAAQFTQLWFDFHFVSSYNFLKIERL